ncbi:MAG: hypothetical protein PHT16_00630 [Candidatus Pacebacteria bacterium]|nr:hypothetical protein [Candidatus Paceibacterota bacterium]
MLLSKIEQLGKKLYNKNNKMITKNMIVKKFISALLIILIVTPAVLFSRPKKADAIACVPADITAVVGTVTSVPVNSTIANAYLGDICVSTTTMAPSTLTNTATTVKGWLQLIAEQALRAVERKLLAQMTQATINWINSDFHGQPLFLTNPGSFFNDIAKSELKNIVNRYGYDLRMFPFGKQFALNAINSYKRQLDDNMGYTLSKVMNSAQQDNFRNNFNVGGWNGFLINTQYPQNNYLGFQMLATDELARQLQGTTQNAAQKVQTALQQGMGFLSPQTCPSNPSYNNGVNEFQKPSFDSSSVTYNCPDGCGVSGAFPEGMEMICSSCNSNYEQALASAKAKWAKTNTCPGGLVNTTPGSVAANQIFEALNVPIKEKTLTAAIGKDVMDSMAAIIDALLGHFIDKGLSALSDTISGTPPQDNWSYNGVTLGGGESGGGGTAGTLNIPQNVSVTVGQTTSTTISGGSGTYNVQPQSSTSLAIAVATIDISGSLPKLTITAGTTPGTTTIVVQDSSSPAKTVTVTITVSAAGAIVVTPANISTTVGGGGQVIATISGGTEPYSIQTGPNETIAVAILSGTNLIVSSLTTSGTTFVDIKDSSSPAKTVRVNIIVSPTNLTITPASISVKVGEVNSNMSISGGTPPYVITNQQNVTIANAEILPTTPTTLTVTGRALGESTVTVTIKDSSNPAKTGTANIVVTP